MSEIFISKEIVKISEHAQMSEIIDFRAPRKSLIFDESRVDIAIAQETRGRKGDF